MAESNRDEVSYDTATPNDIDSSSLTELEDQSDGTVFVRLGRVSAFGPSLDGGFGVCD